MGVKAPRQGAEMVEACRRDALPRKHNGERATLSRDAVQLDVAAVGPHERQRQT